MKREIVLIICAIIVVVFIAYNGNFGDRIRTNDNICGLEISKINVNFSEKTNRYILSFVAANNLDEYIEVEKYNINILDTNNKILYIVGGEAIGKLSKYKSINVAIESYEDLTLAES